MRSSVPTVLTGFCTRRGSSTPRNLFSTRLSDCLFTLLVFVFLGWGMVGGWDLGVMAGWGWIERELMGVEIILKKRGLS